MKLNDSGFKVWYALVGIFIFFFSSIGITMLLPASTGSGDAALASDKGYIGNFFIFVAIAILTIVFLRIVQGKNFTREKAGFAQGSPKRAVLVTILAFAVLLGILFIYEKVVPGAAEAENTAIKLLGLGKFPLRDLVIILTVTVVAPVGEEILFRGLIFKSFYDFCLKFKGLKEKPAVVFAISAVISGILFMTIHMQKGEESALLMYVIMAVLFAATYFLTGSLLAPMLLHNFNNAYTVYTMIKANNIALSAPWLYGLLIASPAIVFLLFYGCRNLLPADLNSNKGR